MEKNKTVTILGAGPSGMITGWLLSKKGWKVNIFEKDKMVGGMCRSWKWKNYTLDTGPHIFHTSDKRLWNFWNKNFGHLLKKGTYYSKNVLGDQIKNLYHYPISHESIDDYPIEIRDIIKKELKLLSKNKNDKFFSKNFFEHIKSQVGKTLAEMFFKNYPEKVWGISVNEMTSDWAPKRIKLTKKSSPFFINEFTAVGRYGTGPIYQLMADDIKKKGGNIFLKHQIEGFKVEENEIKEVKIYGKKNFLINQNDTIISSLPITLTANLLGYKSKLKFRGIRSVYIAINKKRALPKNINWLYFPKKDILFNRISEPKTMSSDLSDKKTTYLVAEIAYSKGDKVDKLHLNDLKKIIIENICRTGLANKNEIIDISDNKEDFVYPVQFVDYKYELSKTKFFVSRYNQIFSLGTGGEFEYSDSQILFHKAKDLVDILNSKNFMQDNVKKDISPVKLNSVVELGNKKVGQNHSTYIIAEAGINHNGSIEIAKKLVNEAKRINCDAVKFQTFQAESRVSKKVKSIKYAEKADGLQEDIFEMFKRLSLTYKQQKELFKHAKKKKIEIFSTPFNETDVDFLEDLGVNFYKIASMDTVNLQLIKKIGLTKKPLILSTGMSNLSIIEDAVNTFRQTGNKNLILLHCLSSYPANENEVNLNAIKTLRANFQVPVGLSDHFPGIEISLMSMGVGCDIIERHFTLDTSFEGPDHILSSEPKEMQRLVNFAQNSKNILGNGQKIIQPSEYYVINTQRKSIYAKKNIRKGEKFNSHNVTIKGPAGGLMPKYSEMIKGKTAKNKIEKDNPITWEDI
jgi:sialic acid synthase SpsE/protoporphyrinogen oxidase